MFLSDSDYIVCFLRVHDKLPLTAKQAKLHAINCERCREWLSRQIALVKSAALSSGTA